jgi:hypothetical protein
MGAAARAAFAVLGGILAAGITGELVGMVPISIMIC